MKLLKKNKGVLISVCAITAAAAACIAAMVIMSGYSYDDPVAKIYSDGKLLYTIKLGEVTEPYELTVTAQSGAKNTILVRNGEIGVTAADCPDKVCINTGFISNGLKPIVCLPNKLEIRITGGNAEADVLAE